MKIKGIHVFVGTVTAFMAAAIILGFLAIGSPELQRSKTLDRQRVADMQSIAGAVDNYWYYRKSLPQTLGDLQGYQGYYVQSINDPETQEPYGYETVSSTGYRLCAEFSQPSGEDGMKASAPYAYRSWTMENFWKHAQGRQCFDLEVSQAPDVKM